MNRRNRNVVGAVGEVVEVRCALLRRKGPNGVPQWELVATDRGWLETLWIVPVEWCQVAPKPHLKAWNAGATERKSSTLRDDTHWRYRKRVEVQLGSLPGCTGRAPPGGRAGRRRGRARGGATRRAGRSCSPPSRDARAPPAARRRRSRRQRGAPARRGPRYRLAPRAAFAASLRAESFFAPAITAVKSVQRTQSEQMAIT